MGTDAWSSWYYSIEDVMDREGHAHITIEAAEELNRLLDVGKLLFSVLTPEEIESLRILGEQDEVSEKRMPLPSDVELGNTSVT
jgi:hypothetical protein